MVPGNSSFREGGEHIYIKSPVGNTTSHHPRGQRLQGEISALIFPLLICMDF